MLEFFFSILDQEPRETSSTFRGIVYTMEMEISEFGYAEIRHSDAMLIL